ncbi:MAG: type VI secretion system ATPase TssH [Bryobacterales bacterium]
MGVNLKSLITKLNPATRRSLEGAAGLCLSRTHYDVEFEHYLTKLLDETDSDLAHILQRFDIDPSRLTGEISRSLDKLKTGNARTPAFSPSLVKMFEQAWTIGSLNHEAGQIRSGFTILALVSNEELARMVRDVSREFQKIQADVLEREFADIVASSPEETQTLSAEAAAPGGGAKKAGGKTPNLDQFTVKLTENARAGKIDPVLGRDFEVRQMVDILTRRRQNNPILTGEAGVGKTAVVEGFALRVAQGDVPPPLKNVEVHSLDLALLQAGAGIKGEFENRLKGLIAEVKSSETPIILFIDEAHTMIGAGGQAGQGDAANLLKPALARGELRTIAATTWSEYKKYFEKDPALSRRFQVVKVEEPDEAQCMVMMRGIVPMLEKHHKVRILDSGVAAAVRFSNRYIAGRQLPDKAVSVLDTTCARLALGQAAIPAALEDLQRRLDDLNVQKRVLHRETAVGADHSERLQVLGGEIQASEGELKSLQERYDKEKALVERVRELRTKLEGLSELQADGSSSNGGAGGPASDSKVFRDELAKVDEELSQLQGETPLMQVCVDSQIVGEVISGWTGIPIGRMLKDEIETAMNLELHLGSRVIGQDHALEIISQRIRTSRAGLEDPSKPIGVFMLVGPSGVGKTETALALADLLYGGERNLITINMSEFQEAHTVSTLKGSPPGYVGYGEGGVLTEAVRRRPYSVVLLDEVEKAHPDVLELFFQVFDKGMMEDGEGREIDFKNTVILLTTNAATETISKLCADPETIPSSAGMVKTIKPELNKIFKPAFLGRMVVVPYFIIRDEIMKTIIRLKLGKVRKRLNENHRIELTFGDDLVNEVAARCTEVESGARNVDNILTNTLLPDISRQLLSRMASGEKLGNIHISVGADSSFAYSYSDQPQPAELAPQPGD